MPQGGGVAGNPYRPGPLALTRAPHHLAALWLFGHKLLSPISDIDRSDCFLMLGANPIASNGSIWTVPDVKKRFRALQARGAKLVVLDPRRTETAEVASEHHFITPGGSLFTLPAIDQVNAVGPGGFGRRHRSWNKDAPARDTP